MNEFKPITYVMERLGLSRWAVDRLVRSGELPCVDLSPTLGKKRMLRFTDEGIDQFLADCQVRASQPKKAAPVTAVLKRPPVTYTIRDLPGADRYSW